MTEFKIDRQLNIVVPVETEKGVAYIHSTPIPRQVFEQYFQVIAKTFAQIYTGGYSIFSGPRVAAMLMKSVAVADGNWEGAAGVQNGLMGEIRRRTSLLVPREGSGWVQAPYYDAVARGDISEDDASEVDNLLAFFTVASAMHKKTDLKALLEGASKLWGGQITSLDCTGFAAGLTTSNVDAPSGPSTTAALPPS